MNETFEWSTTGLVFVSAAVGLGVRERERAVHLTILGVRHLIVYSFPNGLGNCAQRYASVYVCVSSLWTCAFEGETCSSGLLCCSWKSTKASQKTRGGLMLSTQVHACARKTSCCPQPQPSDSELIIQGHSGIMVTYTHNHKALHLFTTAQLDRIGLHSTHTHTHAPCCSSVVGDSWTAVSVGLSAWPFPSFSYVTSSYWLICPAALLRFSDWTVSHPMRERRRMRIWIWMSGSQRNVCK